MKNQDSKEEQEKNLKGRVTLSKKEIIYPFNLEEHYLILPYSIELYADTKRNIFFTLNLN